MSEGDDVCPVCLGAGETAENPSPIRDPQCEIPVPCDECAGTGIVDYYASIFTPEDAARDCEHASAVASPVFVSPVDVLRRPA